MCDDNDDAIRCDVMGQLMKQTKNIREEAKTGRPSRL